MRKNSLITIAVVGHVVFIFGTIYEQAWITRLLYTQQELELEKARVITQKASLEQHLYRLKNDQSVVRFAREKLAMEPASLRSVYVLDAVQHEQ